jgi:hypothetical protein
MNNKFGSDGRYRVAREPFWRGTEGDRTFVSPDQEFETSGNYREPPDTGFRGRGPKGYLRTDDRIREDVCERMSWNDELDATEIDVRVENGDVILEGSVETRYMKRLAGDLAERVPGVIDVHNAIRVNNSAEEALREPKRAAARPPQRSAQAR